MRKIRWLVIPFLMLSVLGCGLFSGIQSVQNLKNAVTTNIPDIQNAVTTQLPDLLTSVPTEQGLIETAAAAIPTSGCTGTAQAGGLGVAMDSARAVLQMTQQFDFSDDSVAGQPAVTVTISTSGATSFPAISDGFKAQFIGDVCNLNEITVTIPRTDQQDSVDQGETAVNLVLTGTLPVDVQLGFLTWVAENYQNMAVSDQQQTTLNTISFTLVRNQDSMSLDIRPAQ